MYILWSGFKDFIDFISDLFKHIFDLIVSVFQLIGEFVTTAVGVIGALPTIFITIGTVSIIVTILFKILGRKSAEE